MKNENKIADLVWKYLQNRCDPKETDEIIQIFHQDQYQKQVETLLYEYWQNTPSFQYKIKKSELNEMLNSIHHQINMEENEQKLGLVRRLSNYLMRTAAILFIPLLIGTLWIISQNQSYNQSESMITLETPLGSKLKTTLPDGTEVWQNSGSTLRYPSNFTRKNRVVYLIGEAYFHVSSDKKNPFLVNTNDGSIKVTGTRFNVSAFADDSFLSVVLEEGEVVYTKAGRANNPIRMLPMEQLIYQKGTGTLIKQKIDVEKYTSWTEGKLIFRNDPLSEVIIRLRRWYNADIVLIDPENRLEKHPFTMTIQNETLQQVLDYISQAANLQLDKQDVSGATNGAFLKTKYMISKPKH